jgi:hypothetical protein
VVAAVVWLLCFLLIGGCVGAWCHAIDLATKSRWRLGAKAEKWLDWLAEL